MLRQAFRYLLAAPDRRNGGDGNYIADLDVGDHGADLLNAADAFVAENAVWISLSVMSTVYVGSAGQHRDGGAQSLKRSGLGYFLLQPSPAYCGFNDAIAFHKCHCFFPPFINEYLTPI